MILLLLQNFGMGIAFWTYTGIIAIGLLLLYTTVKHVINYVKLYNKELVDGKPAITVWNSYKTGLLVLLTLMYMIVLYTGYGAGESLTNHEVIPELNSQQTMVLNPDTANIVVEDYHEEINQLATDSSREAYELKAKQDNKELLKNLGLE